MSEETKSPRTVFVLDISLSMRGMKCQTLHLSATRLIEDIPEGDYVGIVLFTKNAWISHKVVKITNRNVRDSLISGVPYKVSKGTDIGRGLLMALKALTQECLSTDGATLILVTDGEDMTAGNYVNRVLPTLLAANVKIVCIAIGNSADANLERLARETGGNIYIASDTNREMAARVIESTIQEVKKSTEISEALTISVCNQIIMIGRQNMQKNIIIDSDIGRNTTFTISSEDFDKFSLSITSPNGHRYDSNSSELIRSEPLKRYQLKLRSAESGVWTINFVENSKQTLSATVLVTSQPLNINVIQMRVMLKDANSVEQMPPIIIAKLSKGRNAVIGGEVMATVDKPDGTQSHIKLNNYNNYYMNYFTDYCGSGRYNVSVLAKSGSNSVGSSSVSLFERQLIAGCFKVETFMPSKPSNDQLLKDLSLSTAFSSLSIKDNSLNDAIKLPAPRTAKAIINAKKISQQTDDIELAKEMLWDLFLKVKKSINSPKISETERKSMKNTIQEIDVFLNTTTSLTIKDVDNYQRKLEEMEQKLS